MEIPKQLRKKEFRFIRLGFRSKEPVDKWREVNFSYNDKELLDWLEKGNNYGVMCGYGGLVVIDADNIELVREITKKLPKTFTVQTNSGMHFYYLCPDFGRKIIFKKDKVHYGEAQFLGQYVVAPPSIHPTGKIYQIIDHSEIKTIDKNTILNALKNFLPKSEIPKIQKKTSERVLTDEEIEKVVSLFVPIWKKGLRHELTISLIGALIKAGISRASVEKIIITIAERSNDEELKNRVYEVVWHFEKALKEKPLSQLRGVSGIKEILRGMGYTPEKITKFIGKLGEVLWKYEAFFDENGKFKPHLMAEYLKEKYVFKSTEDGKIYVYIDGIYQNKGEIIIRSECEKLYPEITDHLKEEVITHIRDATYVDYNEFNKYPHLIHLKNGIFDLKNNKFMEFSPDIMSTTRIPVKYDPNADCPKIKKFISEIVTEKDIPVLQEMVGYCLWKEYFIHKAFMLLGEGANGKSTFLNLLTKFLGKENVEHIPLQELTSNRFAASRLFGKLANIYPDLSGKALLDTGRFKALVGGDRIWAEEKFKKGFKFTNFSKQIFSANKLPASRDDSYAFYRRWILINFPNTFEGDKADPHILEKISTEEELSGFFNWAVEGLQRLLKNNKFSYSLTVEQTKDKYERFSNSLLAFIKDCIVVDPNGSIPKEEFYNEYVKYCDENNLPKKSKSKVGRELSFHVPVTVVREFVGDKRAWCWKGIRFVSRMSGMSRKSLNFRLINEGIEDYTESKEDKIKEKHGLPGQVGQEPSDEFYYFDVSDLLPNENEGGEN